MAMDRRKEDFAVEQADQQGEEQRASTSRVLPVNLKTRRKFMRRLPAQKVLKDA